MLYFPQLASGATGQYPIRKRRSVRTVLNDCLDGRSVKWADPAGPVTEWELHFAELSDGEVETLETFFLNVEGSLGSFTFLDPVGNLLCWSEDFSQPAWTKDPLLGIMGGGLDAWGGRTAYRLQNGTGANLRIQQTLEAPASYCYTLSLYARSDQPASLALLRDTGTLVVPVTTSWRRLVFSGDSQSAAETIAFGLQLAPGTTVDVCGIQVEPQPGASPYKRSDADGGVYADARLAADSLEITTEGPNRHGCVLRILHAEHS
ncbi:MAG TPA: hypothetical protein VG672_03250 [Bryobacteraceae bacterium]|nr:hypothetical protein [Bryobacteraceae bacterium]